MERFRVERQGRRRWIDLAESVYASGWTRLDDMDKADNAETTTLPSHSES